MNPNALRLILMLEAHDANEPDAAAKIAAMSDAEVLDLYRAEARAESKRRRPETPPLFD